MRRKNTSSATIFGHLRIGFLPDLNRWRFATSFGLGDHDLVCHPIIIAIITGGLFDFLNIGGGIIDIMLATTPRCCYGRSYGCRCGFMEAATTTFLGIFKRKQNTLKIQLKVCNSATVFIFMANEALTLPTTACLNTFSDNAMKYLMFASLK